MRLRLIKDRGISTYSLKLILVSPCGLQITVLMTLKQRMLRLTWRLPLMWRQSWYCFCL